jgi:hypothetical protein
MAGDWIKMRSNLWDDPRVARLCDLTNQGEGPIIGALYWLWATADQHTEDGILPGLTLRQIDRKTGVPGFGAAMCEIGWLADHPEGVRILRFEEHNGSSAKRRCMEAQRKANGRKVSARDADTQQTKAGRDATKIGRHAELEKDIEKEIQPQESTIPSVVGASKSPRPTRKCPESFAVTAELREWASRSTPGIDTDAETAKFRDHTFRNAITDWPGAWRNWMRRAFEDRRPASGRGGASSDVSPFVGAV